MIFFDSLVSGHRSKHGVCNATLPQRLAEAVEYYDTSVIRMLGAFLDSQEFYADIYVPTRSEFLPCLLTKPGSRVETHQSLFCVVL